MDALKIAFLCSGGGGNLRFIWHAIQRNVMAAEICGVFADRECAAAIWAIKRKLPVICGDYSPENPSPLTEAMERFHPDLAISLFHKIIAPPIVDRYPRQIVNLHYSLIPAFCGFGMIGAKPVRLAVQRGCRIVGTTVHYVDGNVDAGEIISQSAIEIDPLEPFGAIMNRVFHSGCLNLLRAVATCGRMPCDEFGIDARLWEDVSKEA